MSQRDVTTVTGRAVLVRMDSDTKKPMRIPDGLRAEIEAL
jgi:acyl-CoA thioesterase FadM